MKEEPNRGVGIRKEETVRIEEEEEEKKKRIFEQDIGGGGGEKVAENLDCKVELKEEEGGEQDKGVGVGGWSRGEFVR